MARSRDLHPRLADHRVPAWWRDAKLGIFVHWTPASVPAFAPTGDDIGALLARRRPDALAHTPYTEWYENSLRFPDSPAAAWHREHHPGRAYESFTDDFVDGLTTWDPDGWAGSFAAAGARYVVLVAKHHDGWCLWPTAVPNPHRPGWHCERDLVGELCEAVRARGLRFGVYYSGGLDWTFEDRPIGTFSDMIDAVPGGAYPAYAAAQVRELVDRYRPDVLWNDIAWPGDLAHLREVLARYYRAVPDGVINDRWMHRSAAWRALDSSAGRWLLDQGVALASRRASETGVVPPTPRHWDVRTPEYAVFDDVRDEPWECVRGIDRSFGYNRLSDDSHHLSRRELIAMTADIASKGGNLLLNVGPRGEDATIPELQQRRLDWLGEWEAANGLSLHDTRPWVRPQATLEGGGEVRFTARGRYVHAVLLAADEPDAELRGSLVIPDVEATATTEVVTPRGDPVPWRSVPGGAEVDLAAPAPAAVVVLRDVRAAPETGYGSARGPR